VARGAPGSCKSNMTDPRFPNRPNHPDFWMMSKAVISLDTASDTGVSFADTVGDIDIDSLAYMAQQRALRAATILATPVTRESRIMATWLDGFMVGVKFQKLKDDQQT
jgi:hypothetical protein